MKSKFFIALAIVWLVILFSCFFVVKETQQVVVTRFGKPIGKPITEAGLHFKLPLIDTAVMFEKRVLEWDGDPNQIPTRDKKYILVDTTARWKIVDALTFLQTVGNENGAQSRLDDIIDSSIRNEVTQHDLIEIVRNSNRVLKVLRNEREGADDAEEDISAVKIEVGREKITRKVLEDAIPTIKKYGIELIDVRIKGLNYEASVQEKVFNRMISERKKIAQKIRSEGLAEKAKIDGRHNLDLKTIEAKAYRKAEEIRGLADAEATKIYAKAYETDPDFYNFQASLRAYQDVINENGTLILGTDAEVFKVLKSAGK